MEKLQIATWFVADNSEEATFFPQVNARSDTAEAQAVYWRCIAVFFASSLAVNPHRAHVLYANCQPPVVDGIDLAALFRRWRVQLVQLEPGFRLPRGQVSSWGNQFYIFDILSHFLTIGTEDQLLLLDSDCLWRRSADGLSKVIGQYGALTYPLGFDEHPMAEAINGLSRAGMARFVTAIGGPEREWIDYCGGEILAVDRATGARVLDRFRSLWPRACEGGECSPREEAHMLSAIYLLEGTTMGSAAGFIRRMWTTFRRNTLDPSDCHLAIWHLPAEKRTGFRDLFAQLARNAYGDPRSDSAAMGLTDAAYRKAMGWPHRSLSKCLRDLHAKIAEKLH